MIFYENPLGYGVISSPPMVPELKLVNFRFLDRTSTLIKKTKVSLCTSKYRIPMGNGSKIGVHAIQATLSVTELFRAPKTTLLLTITHY